MKPKHLIGLIIFAILLPIAAIAEQAATEGCCQQCGASAGLDELAATIQQGRTATDATALRAALDKADTQIAEMRQAKTSCARMHKGDGKQAHSGCCEHGKNAKGCCDHKDGKGRCAQMAGCCRHADASKQAGN
jgi:hypothetical protein